MNWLALARMPCCCCRTLAKGVAYLFMDMRLISTVMVIWLAIVLIIMVEIGIFDNSSFVAFGPRKELTFMHVSVDTQYKYNMLVGVIIVHTFISDFISDSLNPHLLNALQNTGSRYLPHTPHTYYIVTTVYSFYCGISQLFLIFIAFAQLDLLLVRLLSDIAANFLTTTLYLQNKVYDPVKFYKFEEEMQVLQNHAAGPGTRDEIVFEDSVAAAEAVVGGCGMSCSGAHNNNNTNSNHNKSSSHSQKLVDLETRRRLLLPSPAEDEGSMLSIPFV